MKKKCRNLSFKIWLDFRLGSNWHIFWFMNLGVANLRFDYLRCFSINFENSCAHLAANFLNFSKHTHLFRFGWFEESYGQITKKLEIQKMWLWANTEIWPFFRIGFQNFLFISVVQEYLNEISPTLHGPNKLKTSGNPLRIADLQLPASGHPVVWINIVSASA